MPFTKTFHGFIENITDTLLIIEACRNGLLPTINRRLIERERSAIKSGTIIVFDESESGIKRWTDGFLWSPSRILGNFLVYRELANRENRTIDDDDFTLSNNRNINSEESSDTSLALLHQRERALVGSLTTANTSYNFKKDGLIKKTIRIMVNGNYLHIVSYYNKNDVLDNLLPTPSASPQLACLQISADLMPHLQGLPPAQHQHSNIYHHSASTIPSLSSSTSSTSSASVRKRSRSYDEQHEQQLYHNRQRQRSCQQPQQRYPYPYSMYNSGNMLPSQQPPNIDYPTPAPFYSHSSSYYSTTANGGKGTPPPPPFTELPLPLPSLSDYQVTTTARGKNYESKYYHNSIVSNSVSPSPSPTPSPPTTLPRVTTVTCGNDDHRSNYPSLVADNRYSNSTSFDDSFNNNNTTSNGIRQRSSTLENY